MGGLARSWRETARAASQWLAPARIARARRKLGAGVALLLWTGCASPPQGPVHVMRPGENLYRVSRYYAVSVEDIKRANGIRDVTKIPVGSRLVIPGAARPPPRGSLAAAELGPAPNGFRGGERALARRESNLDFAWPLSGRISSKFGRRKGRRHDGVDIAAKRGTPVRAAEAGRVIYSGRLRDYGRVIIVKHAGQYSTVYAHNRRNRVRKGEFVEKGEIIAEVGSSGNATGSHLHFEVRRKRRPLDPLLYLP